MRIDEIDLYGDFKINGLTGTTGQFLGMSGSDLVWLDAGVSTGGMSVYGSRYVYCNSVTYSATMSGQLLKEAYASASTIGGLSADTRAAVLISPGTYDFDTNALEYSLPYIDLVGINSDANSVRLKATNSPYVIYVEGGSMDIGLYNLSIGTASLFNVACAGNDYQRWGNVINYGNMFTDFDTSNTDLMGDFRNIKVYHSTYPFTVIIGNVDGIFQNIKIENSSSTPVFYTEGSINGTFSNIEVSGPAYHAFFSNLSLSGTFENVKIEQCDDSLLSTMGNGGNLSGTFRNIEVGTTYNFLYNASTNIYSNAENIKLDGVLSSFVRAGGGSIEGTFSNIQIGDCSEVCFFGGYHISGSYDNITVGNVGLGLPNNSGKLFYGQNGYIDGNFKNIKFGTLLEGVDGSGQFFGCGSTVSGTFENIEGKEAGVAFYTINNNGDGIVGTFSNIKFGNITGVLFLAENSGSINGTFENITCATVSMYSFYSQENLSGTFKDITIGNSQQAFKAFGGNISGSYQNITVKDVTDFFVLNGNITGTFENIKFGNIDNGFKGSDLIGTFTNIEGGTIITDVFFATSIISGTFKNIDLGGLIGGSNNVFYSNGAIEGTFEDIKMDALGGFGNNIFYAANAINGIFKNIDTNTFGPGLQILQIDNFFNSGDFIFGTFSNISAGGIDVAFQDNLSVYGNFTNLNINAGSIFSIGGFGSPKIKNSVLYGRVGLRSGSLVDSTVDYSHGVGVNARAVVVQDGATIERCKLLANASANSVYSGSAVNAKISLTIANRAFNGNVTNLISTPNNIIDASIS